MTRKDDDRAYFERMQAFENGPFTTNFQQLVRAGIALPEPEALDDAAVTRKLWEVIEALADLGVILEQTNHLSDRELYAELWHRVLRDEVPDLAPAENEWWHVDLIGTGSNEHIHAYLKYYADDEDRRFWHEVDPKLELPPHEDPPFDRDRRLPGGVDHQGTPADLSS